MKTKVLFVLAILFMASTLTSCQTKEERIIGKMESLAERVDKNAETNDSEDWEAVLKEYAQLQEEAVKCDFTQEQYKELGRIEAKLTSVLTSEGAKSFGREFDNLLQNGKNFIDGFMQGITEE